MPYFDLGLVLLIIVAIYFFISTQIIKPQESGTPSFPLFRRSSRQQKAKVASTTEQVEALREEVKTTQTLAELEAERSRAQAALAAATAAISTTNPI